MSGWTDVLRKRNKQRWRDESMERWISGWMEGWMC